jgi:hypothetical protein
MIGIGMRSIPLATSTAELVAVVLLRSRPL